MKLVDQIWARLKNVKYPGFTRDIVSFGLVKKVEVIDDVATIELVLSTQDEKICEQLRQNCEQALDDLSEIKQFNIHIHREQAKPSIVAPDKPPTVNTIPGVKRVIAIASGKGGVGKSTVAANLACAFQQIGWKTGLCDCDIYGPSMALMFNVHEAPQATEDERIIPIEQYGIKLMSMGFLVDASAPAILRGPMVTRFIQQFLKGVVWEGLDVLVLDLPPGTGDIQLTIVQTLALDGAVIVTTPQEVALIDARKAVGMFQKVNVPILGLIENMSYFLCPSDGKRYDIFGSEGGKQEAKRLGVPLLAEVPIDMATREAGDLGKPVVISHPESKISEVFRQAAESITKVTEKI